VNGGSLRSLREALGLQAPELADRADCPVEVVLRAEFGICVPTDQSMRVRIAQAYQLSTGEYLRLAFDAAARFTSRQQV